ncbi:MAG: RNA-binding S4 domain-containing protein [Epulopiscium sp.]|nr:RNA-binding S4 domain-containing protein [Candidatus Epulonipiscium sp.]
MEKVKINTEYIRLDQFLKYVNIVSSGSEAKYLILQNNIKVNGITVNQRGKKLRSGDQIEIEGKIYIIID